MAIRASIGTALLLAVGAIAGELPDGALARLGAVEPRDARRGETPPPVGFVNGGHDLAWVGDEGFIHIYDLYGAAEKRAWDARQGNVTSFAASPDGSHLASGGEDGSIALWDASDGSETLRIKCNCGPVDILVFSADGGRLLSRAAMQIEQWDAVKGGRIALPPPSRDCLVFGPRGSGRAAGVTATGFVWDPVSGQAVYCMASGGAMMACSATSADRKCFASNSGSGGVILFEVATGEELVAPKGDCDEVTSLAMSSDASVLVTVGRDDTVRWWDLQEGVETARRTGLCAGKVALSADGRFAATGMKDGTILVWDVHGVAPPPFREEASPTREDLHAWWAGLSSIDGRVAHRASWRLLAHPQAAVAFLAERLTPAAIDDERVRGWIRDLDDDRYEVREQASRALGAMRDAARPRIEAALAEATSPAAEARHRELLEDAPTGLPLGGERPAESRAIGILERIGNDDAQRALERIAAGAPSVLRTRDAQAALDGLARRRR